MAHSVATSRSGSKEKSGDTRMKPDTLGKKYDKIATWWQEQHDQGEYGVTALKRALQLHGAPADGQAGLALDVGCGAGGRFIRRLESAGFQITGLDVSAEMVRLAAATHPAHRFQHQDICTWQTNNTYDFILAWDSLFHLPMHEQKPVVAKLCAALKPCGTLLYTFGNAVGDHEDQWQDDIFYYSSIGIAGNLQLLLAHGLTIQHLELDQYPQPHVFVIATRPAGPTSSTG